MATFAFQTISDEIVETLHSNWVTPKNKRIHTPRLSFPFKVGVIAVFYRSCSSNSGTTLPGGDGRGKALFSPFEVGKSPFRAKCTSQLIYFVADCSLVSIDYCKLG